LRREIKEEETNMSNKFLPKITEIEGGAAQVASPEFSLATNGEVVFLVGGSETPLTVKVKGFAGESGKHIAFKGKSLTDEAWTEVGAEGLSLESTGAFLVRIEADNLGHGGIDRVALELSGGEDGTTPEVIFAFEVASRYSNE
jgi:hypothetical protein